VGSSPPPAGCADGRSLPVRIRRARTVLVPALAYDVGSTIWWPSKLSTTGQRLPRTGRHRARHLQPTP